MKKIPLTQGKFALVDDDDYEKVSRLSWYVDKRGYAVNKKIKITYMHRLIMNTPKEMETDHINGNKLDNRKINLRICTKSENMRNRKKQSNNTSGYKGVFWHHKANRWRAQIVINKKAKHLGLFDTPEEAGKAYREAELKYFGEYSNRQN